MSNFDLNNFLPKKNTEQFDFDYFKKHSFKEHQLQNARSFIRKYVEIQLENSYEETPHRDIVRELSYDVTDLFEYIKTLENKIKELEKK